MLLFIFTTKTKTMKRSSILLTMLAIALFSLNATAQKKDVKQVANKAEDMPYKIANTDLRFGNSQYSTKVLQAWKAYDNNDLDKIAGMFADDVVGTLPDGTTIKGRDALVNAMKAYRGGFASVVSAVNACTTLKSAENPDSDATLIWGFETDTKKDGTVQRMAIHEAWFFNKDGKVYEFHQFASPILDGKK